MAEIAAGRDTETPDKAARTLRTIEGAARWPISTPSAAERSGRAQT
ncbi:hypothetical protein ACFY0A_24500 [Streptomyces sp. NPDC001698]